MNALVESSPEVGSSKKRRIGSWMMSIPIETLRRSPPETPRWPSSPIMRLRGKRNSAAKVRVSSTVSIGKRRSSCITYAEITFKSRDPNASPFSATVPLSFPFAILFASASISVDFPEPLAPSTAMISPSRASPEISFNKVLVRVNIFSPTMGSTATAAAPSWLRRFGNNAGKLNFHGILTLYVRLPKERTNGTARGSFPTPQSEMSSAWCTGVSLPSPEASFCTSPTCLRCCPRVRDSLEAGRRVTSWSSISEKYGVVLYAHALYKQRRVDMKGA
ncbi:hypothetical protein Lal_00047859 [Lupinus albus]|nr:hypothetical protein Lal_00047859 [Lupinus albus]